MNPHTYYAHYLSGGVNEADCISNKMNIIEEIRYFLLFYLFSKAVSVSFAHVIGMGIVTVSAIL